MDEEIRDELSFISLVASGFVVGWIEKKKKEIYKREWRIKNKEHIKSSWQGQRFSRSEPLFFISSLSLLSTFFFYLSIFRFSRACNNGMPLVSFSFFFPSLSLIFSIALFSLCCWERNETCQFTLWFDFSLLYMDIQLVLLLLMLSLLLFTTHSRPISPFFTVHVHVHIYIYIFDDVTF